MSRMLALFGGALALAACAPTTDGGQDQGTPAQACFYPDQVDNFRTESARTTYIRSRQGDVFQLEAVGPCFQPAGTRSIAVEPMVQARQRLCPGDQVRVRITTTSSTPLVCSAQVRGPIMDSSVSGLPARGS